VPHLARSTASYQLGNISIRRHLAGWYLLNNAQHQFGVCLIHRVTIRWCRARP
jgi:hypothetical protein